MIARLEAGNAREALADFDAAEVVRDVAELYEALAEEAGVPLEVDVDGRPAGARQPRAARAGGGEPPRQRAQIRPRRRSPAPRPTGHRHGAARSGDACGSRSPIAGRAFPEAERGHVLERFVRLESARSRPGFGLGLSLAAAVARLHGGALRLEDNEPGLRAVLALPLAPSPNGTSAASAVRLSGSSEALSRRRRRVTLARSLRDSTLPPEEASRHSAGT